MVEGSREALLAGARGAQQHDPGQSLRGELDDPAMDLADRRRREDHAVLSRVLLRHVECVLRGDVSRDAREQALKALVDRTFASHHDGLVAGEPGGDAAERRLRRVRAAVDPHRDVDVVTRQPVADRARDALAVVGRIAIPRRLGQPVIAGATARRRGEPDLGVAVGQAHRAASR
jgi:hypothetical protein